MMIKTITMRPKDYTEINEMIPRMKCSIEMNKIDMYIGGRQCREAWKLINDIKNHTENKLHLSPIKPVEWIL